MSAALQIQTEIQPHSRDERLLELILDEAGKAAGAVLMNLETREYLVVRAKTVIIATGGAGSDTSGDRDRVHIRGQGGERVQDSEQSQGRKTGQGAATEKQERHTSADL